VETWTAGEAIACDAWVIARYDGMAFGNERAYTGAGNETLGKALQAFQAGDEITRAHVYWPGEDGGKARHPNAPTADFLAGFAAGYRAWPGGEPGETAAEALDRVVARDDAGDDGAGAAAFEAGYRAMGGEDARQQYAAWVYGQEAGEAEE
jgi:hypothetical protein